MRIEIELEINKLKTQIQEWKRRETARVANDASAMTLFVESVASRLFELAEGNESAMVKEVKRMRVVK